MPFAPHLVHLMRDTVAVDPHRHHRHHAMAIARAKRRREPRGPLRLGFLLALFGRRTRQLT